MSTPALSTTSVTVDTEPTARAQPVLSLGPVLEVRRQGAAERSDTTAATSAIVQELGPRFDGLIPQSVIERCVAQAVQDLLGSICVEALPEMAIRLAAVRLERRLEPMSELSAPPYSDAPS